MLDAASMFSDELTEAILEEQVTEELIRAAIRKATIALKITPVFMGSAYKNKGVQLLLDGVVHYLPDPTEVESTRPSTSTRTSEKVVLDDRQRQADRGARVQARGRPLRPAHVPPRLPGQARKRDCHHQHAHGKKDKVGRLVRMHADEMEDIDDAGAGDIVAMFGIDCNSGDTFTDGKVNSTMTSMHVPEPVISVAIKPKDAKSRDQHVQGAQPLHQGGPDLPRRHRRGVERDDHPPAWASCTSRSTSSA